MEDSCSKRGGSGKNVAFCVFALTAWVESCKTVMRSIAKDVGGMRERYREFVIFVRTRRDQTDWIVDVNGRTLPLAQLSGDAALSYAKTYIDNNFDRLQSQFGLTHVGRLMRAS